MKIGVLGAGQLGRMLALAGYPLGLQFRFYDHSTEAPAGHMADVWTGKFDDWEGLERFAQDLDAITYEFENVPVKTAHFLQGLIPVYPPPAALEAAQDRIIEKNFLRGLGIPTPPFAPVLSEADLMNALGQFGYPAVLKTRTMGYDGKGQVVIEDPLGAGRAWSELGGAALILEGFIEFDRELSLLAVRALTGEMAYYPLVENEHRQGILRKSIAPARGLSQNLQTLAEEYSRRVLLQLDYVGVLAIEFFQVDGGLVANEMAPRVHNSGHWSIEGAETSQFENHLRAILGWPLGSTAPREFSAMLNIIGRLPKVPEVLSTPGTHLHLYGKEPRLGRKLGHITVLGETREDLWERLEMVSVLL
jgi:5-(carboxyamino)imidazole ribonucleotide synthase